MENSQSNLPFSLSQDGHDFKQSLGASSTSSNPNSDDEDESTQFGMQLTHKDRRRELHTQAEQKRRDAIKRGYEELLNLVHPGTPSDPAGPPKMSKATILQKSVSQIERLTKQKRQKEMELDHLRKEVLALKIMNANYEHIVKANQSGSNGNVAQIPDEVKFQVFQSFTDQLFHSFNTSISVNNFAEASGCIINWLEEQCKPQCLTSLMQSVLAQTLTQHQLLPNQGQTRPSRGQNKMASSTGQNQYPPGAL